MKKETRIIIVALFCLAVVAASAADRVFSKKERLAKDEARHLLEFQLEKKAQKEVPENVVKPGAVKVPIFVYHSVRPHYPNESKYQDEYDITPELLGEQLIYLYDHGFTTIPFDALVDYFAKNTPLPKKPVILSFDDGWQNQYTYAFPVLQKNHATATFFIYTNRIGHGHFMSWDEIRSLAAAGMEIGGHTKSHPILTKIDDPQKLREEIFDSKKIIEQHLRNPVHAFAYPFGQHSEMLAGLVREAGYTSARALYRGTYHTKDELFVLKSFLISDNVDEFKKIIGN